nr:hypothetical protein [Tanacetum cinerariifolium]
MKTNNPSPSVEKGIYTPLEFMRPVEPWTWVGLGFSWAWACNLDNIRFSSKPTLTEEIIKLLEEERVEKKWQLADILLINRHFYKKGNTNDRGVAVAGRAGSVVGLGGSIVGLGVVASSRCGGLEGIGHGNGSITRRELIHDCMSPQPSDNSEEESRPPATHGPSEPRAIHRPKQPPISD